MAGRDALAALARSIFAFRRSLNSEETFLRRTLERWSYPGAKLLEVGCGESRFFPIIHSLVIDYVGIDSNPRTVAQQKALGRAVYLPDDFEPAPKFNFILMSHIIEHLEYPRLLDFFGRYLPAMIPGGILIILTPLQHRGFYDDFDHVKPYSPNALRQVLCGLSSQTQPYAVPGQFDELDLWLKRDPLWHTHRRGRWTHACAAGFTLLWIASLGLFGRLTGYGMVLRRSQQ